MIDLDGFKPINDIHGHEAGDVVLCEIARRLHASVRDVDFVARFGGDEFICVLESIVSIEVAAKVGNNILEGIGQFITLPNGVDVRLGASIGIAFYNDEVRNADDLKAAADRAMYEAKSAGKNCCRFAV